MFHGTQALGPAEGTAARPAPGRQVTPAPIAHGAVDGIAGCTADLHLFRLDVSEAQLAHCVARLTGDEISRGALFGSTAERRRYLVARARLRETLGRYLALPPRDIAIGYGPRGKPRIRSTSGLHFSIAHAGELGAIVVSRHARVGVDIEVQQERRDVEAAALLALSDAEQSRFFALPKGSRRHAFYRAWCRKEAFVKALGCGMHLDPGRFSVSLDDEPRLLEVMGTTPRSWSLKDLPPMPGYAGAIAVHARNFRLNRCH
jgi:4'-phosphopantetheinyl transferase